MGDEPHPPYQRPPLSKKFLAGEIELDRLYVKPAAFYAKAGTKLMLDTRVAGIDRQARAIKTEAGPTLRYSTLVIATGSRPRPLALPGADLEGVMYLRTIADVEAIRRYLERGRRLVIVGGGYIGLELAAVAAKRGVLVTVLEQAPRVMARGVGPIVSAFYERLHREEGVTIATGTAVTGFDGNGRLEQVVCEGTRLAADLVVVGVGAIPNSELAREAASPSTTASSSTPSAARRIRPSTPSAIAPASRTRCSTSACGSSPCTARSSKPGRRRRRSAGGLLLQTPWFWSDQYDVKLQMAGLSARHDTVVVRGDPDRGRSFAVFYLRQGELVAVDAVNRAPEFMMSKQLIAERSRVDPSSWATNA